MNLPSLTLQKRCVYINLDHSIERREHTEKQFQGLGVAVQRAPGVNGKSLDQEFCRSLNPLGPRSRDLSNTEIGCFLSHRVIWQALVDSDQPYVAIFEDDIRFSSDATEFLSDFSWINSGIDLIKLDSLSWHILLSDKQPLSNGRQLGRVHSKTVMTAGYVISRRCAAFLLEKTEVMTAPVDIMMFDPKYRTGNDLPYWQIAPSICTQDLARNTERFLPDSAYASTIREPKKHQKRDAAYYKSKLVREALRPFKQLRTVSLTIVLFMQYRAIWTRVSFRD